MKILIVNAFLKFFLGIGLSSEALPPILVPLHSLSSEESSSLYPRTIQCGDLTPSIPENISFASSAHMEVISFEFFILRERNHLHLET